MGPKSKKKTKDTDDNKAAEEDYVPEVLKQFFEIQISDIKEKTERIRKTSQELIQEKTHLEEKIISFTAEKKIKINELKALAETKEELKIQKRQEMLLLVQEIKDKVDALKNHITELENNYANMIEEMIAKREDIEAQVSALEDFKKNKEKYLGQFDLEEVLLREMEEEHQRNLYEINQKYEFMKIRLKKELESRLLQLSIEFQATTESKLGVTTQRLIRENIAIENEIKIMEGTLKEYEEEYEKSKNNVRQYRYQQRIRDEEKDGLIAKTIIQVDISKKLIMDIAKLSEKLDEIHETELEYERLTKFLIKLEEDLKFRRGKSDELQKYLKIKIEEAETINEKIMTLRKNFRRLQVLLRHSIKILEEAKALHLIPIGAIELEKDLSHEEKLRRYQIRRDHVYQKRGKILDSLLHLLSEAQLPEEVQKLIESTESTEHLDFDMFAEKDEEVFTLEEPDTISILTKYTSVYTTGSDLSLPRSLSTVRNLSVGQARSNISEVTQNFFLPTLSEEEGEAEDFDLDIGNDTLDLKEITEDNKGSLESVMNPDFNPTFAE